MTWLPLRRFDKEASFSGYEPGASAEPYSGRPWYTVVTGAGTISAGLFLRRSLQWRQLRPSLDVNRGDLESRLTQLLPETAPCIHLQATATMAPSPNPVIRAESVMRAEAGMAESVRSNNI
jgi:hypothetical protein